MHWDPRPFLSKAELRSDVTCKGKRTNQEHFIKSEISLFLSLSKETVQTFNTRGSESKINSQAGTMVYFDGGKNGVFTDKISFVFHIVMVAKQS